ncbi:AAA family ATPase [Sphingomonas alpina]|uniref:AAA family ATPase n=1 Tax=Sphingomonas alpina TaxID=653931 RepID=A0A7H0LMQ7_9SPHN|nr:AAA family ATPase [Sphingomonas alpina]QNQ10960.1 AAA family ATPase [Sphingomonas alpina]
MYDDHYGLSGRPFQLTPDPRFWFDTATHRKAMAYLGYGLSQGEGFIVITGDIGAGKTTLVGHLMATVDRERLNVIKIVSTQIEAEDLLRMVAGGLDIETAGQTKSQLLTAIERGLHATARSGRRTLLIVDEAQALPVSALEELRMLSNFQAGGHALLQIFLLGQPEFRQRLHGSDRLEQLRQRVIAMHHLDPMGPEEVEPYMVHRLSVVGWQGRPSFTPEALQALYRGSGGVPRVLNQLAGRVLLFGAIDQLEIINGDVVDAVIADIAGDSPMPRPINRARAEPVPAVDAVEAPEPAVEALEPVDAAKPIPIVNAPRLPVEPRPIRFALETETAPEVPPVAAPQAVSAPERAASIPDQALIDRIAALEERVEEQEAALRRVLTLLVDWVEGEGSPDIASVRHAAGR